MNNNNHACWATVFPGQVPDSNGPQQAEFLGGEPYRFRYRTPSGSVATDVTVFADRIIRSVRANAAATEQIPLVVRDSDVLELDQRGLTLTRGRVVLRFDWAAALEPALRPASITYPGRRMHILTVPHNGSITVTVSAASS